MQLWFYKAKHGDWKDWLISWWTKGPHSHVELVFSDGKAFSSSPRDGGCRFKDIELSDRWDVIDLKPRLDYMAASYLQSPNGLFMQTPLTTTVASVSASYEKEIRDWCKEQDGKAYDWKAVFGFTLFDTSFEDRTKWYCSEVILYALKKFGVWNGKYRVHPNEMYASVLNNSYKNKEDGVYPILTNGVVA